MVLEYDVDTCCDDAAARTIKPPSIRRTSLSVSRTSYVMPMLLSNTACRGTEDALVYNSCMNYVRIMPIPGYMPVVKQRLDCEFYEL